MTTNILRRALSRTILTLAITVSVCSCSNDAVELLRTVPSSAKAVVTMDLSRLLEESGITIDKENVKLPNELALLSSQIPQDIQTAVADVYNSIDASNLVIFAMGDREEETVVTFNITDPSRLQKQTEGLPTEQMEGFTVYDLDGALLATGSDGQGWITSDYSKAISQLRKWLDTAAEKNIADNKGLTAVLSERNAVNGVADFSNSFITGYWAAFSGNLNHSKAELRMQVIGENGEVMTLDKMEMLAPIDTEALEYAPGNTVASAAIGFNPSFDWNKLSTLAMMGGMRSSALSVAAGVLNALDGTVTVSAAPRTDKSFDWGHCDVSDWTVTATAQIHESDASSLMSQLKMLAMMAGSNTSGTGSDSFAFDLNKGCRVYVSHEDGMIIAGINAPAARHSNDLGSIMANKYAGAIVRLPRLRDVFQEFPFDFGVRLSYMLENDALVISAEVTDTSKSLMDCIFSVMAYAYQQSVGDFGALADQDYDDVEEVELPDDFEAEDY